MPLFRRKAGRPRFRYSRWDGTQVGFELDADEVMAEITDDLLYHGDLNAALRRMLQSGFDDRRRRAPPGPPGDARAAAPAAPGDAREPRPRRGLRRDRRRAPRGRRPGAGLARGDGPGRRRVGRPTPPGGHRRGRRSSARWSSTSCRPTSPARCKALQEYEFTSSEAREKFEELLDQLREQLMQRYVDQMSGSMQSMSPRGHGPDEGHAGRAQPDARAAGRRARSPTSTGSWSATATSSRRTPRPSTSCSSSWPSAWRRCRRCSTR